MADEIKADYEQLNAIASRFANKSSEIQQLLGRVKASMDPLQNDGWIGRGSNAFFSEMNGEVLPAILRLTTALKSAAEVTRQIANTMQSAEEEASGFFRQDVIANSAR